MKPIFVVLSLTALVVASGCNSETAEQKRNREMTEMLQRGARDPVDWSARNNPPSGAYPSLLSNSKKKTGQ